MKAKKVELTELFYDLVYVFAISKMTALIHHPHHGVIDLFSIFTFISCLVVVVNTWFVEVVFINRYGKNGMKNVIPMLLSMIPLLFLSNTFTTVNWESVFFPYTLATASLSLIEFIQYWLEYRSSQSEIDQKICKDFMFSLGIRTVLLLVAVLIPYQIGIVLFFIAIIAGTILPAFFVKDFEARPINFPHLVERITLLVIITFGEMIIGIAPFFTIKTFDIYGILVFFIVAHLFLYYIMKFEHVIDHHRSKETGVKIIYLHYLIFISLSIITVSLSFFLNEDVNSLFRNTFLSIGLLLFYGSVLAHGNYNKVSYPYDKTFMITQVFILTIGVLLNIVFHSQTHMTIILVMLMTLLSFVHYFMFYQKGHGKLL